MANILDFIREEKEKTGKVSSFSSKKATFVNSSMKKVRINSIKWILTLLFVSYISGISFFTHTHVFNKSVYVHSHPFSKSEKNNHTHTESQLTLLDHFYHTSLTEDVIPEIDCAACLPYFVKIGVKLNTIHHLTNIPNNTQLRAPPVAA